MSPNNVVTRNASGNLFAQQVDRGPWEFFDRLTTAAGSTTSNLYAFFTVGQSNTKTPSDTNLIRNILPPPRALSVQSLGFIFGTQMLFADMAQFIKNYYFQFFISGKPYADGAVDMWPGGAGLSGAVATNHGTTALIQVLNNGDPSVSAMRRFADYPRLIPADIPFYCNVQAGAGTFSLAAQVNSTIVSPAYGGLDLRCVLDGILDREVQ